MIDQNATAQPTRRNRRPTRRWVDRAERACSTSENQMAHMLHCPPQERELVSEWSDGERKTCHESGLYQPSTQSSTIIKPTKICSTAYNKPSGQDIKPQQRHTQGSSAEHMFWYTTEVFHFGRSTIQAPLRFMAHSVWLVLCPRERALCCGCKCANRMESVCVCMRSFWFIV